MTQDKNKTKAQLIEELVELREINRRHKTSTELSPVGVFSTDAEGQCLFVNERWCEIARISSEEAVGDGWVQGLHPDDRQQVEEKWYECARRNLPFNCEYRFGSSEGATTWVLGQAVAEKDDSGNILGYVGTITDITDRKKIEDRLGLVGVITEQVSDAVIATDLDFQIIYTNQAFRDLYGYDKEEMIGRSPDFLNAEPLATEIQHEIYVTVASGETWRGTVLNKRKDDSTFTCDLAIFPLVNDNGETFAYAGTQRDITEREQVERSLKQSEEKFRLVTETIQDVLWISTPGITEMIYVSPAYETIWRRSRESLYKSPRSFLEALHPEDKNQYLANVESLHASGKAYECEYRIVMAGGPERWIYERGFPITNDQDDVVLMTGICTDITERKQAEEKLRESEERFRNLAEMLPEAIFETDSNLNMSYANQRAFDVLGYSPEDMSDGLNAFDMLVPEDRDRARANFAKRVGGRDPGATEYEALRKDGSTVPILFHANSILRKDGEVQGVRGVFVDITERKQAETDLLRFKLGIERCDEAIFITDPEGLFLYVNPAFEKLYGFTREEVVGKTPRVLKSGEIPQETYEQFWKTLISRDVVAGEIVNKTKDGHIISVYGTANPILDEKDVVIGYLAIQRDITEQKRAERDRLALEGQVQHAQKLDSLGILAGGIAHDFNNLLMGVLGNAEMALADLSPASPVRANIAGIQAAAKRAAELANQMLAYSGKGQFIVKSVSLSEVVHQMGPLLSAAVTKKITLKYKLDETIPAIEADVAQIRQVVMNLITNAAEAFEQEIGRVTVSTGVWECTSTRTKRALVAGELSEGFYSYLEVTDTGAGMDKETVEKMFDPFFSTKFTGRGLGLAALFGIVRGHKGAILVVSAPSKGTTITVLFPVTEKPAESLRDTGEWEVDTKAQGTILLVDDEATVLEVAARMLKRAGYEVRTARDGSEAIEVFKKHSSDTDCIILDLTMPHMDGEETFVELQNIRKDVPVVLSSGYSVGDVEERISTNGFGGFLQKPYRITALKKVLREVLSK